MSVALMSSIDKPLSTFAVFVTPNADLYYGLAALHNTMNMHHHPPPLQEKNIADIEKVQNSTRPCRNRTERSYLPPLGRFPACSNVQVGQHSKRIIERGAHCPLPAVIGTGEET